MADGFHRVSGARKAGLSDIAVDLALGTKRDAIFYACGSNKHGKARTNDDKRRAVTRMLELVWTELQRGEWSNVKIAKHCGVTEAYVRKLRREREITVTETVGGDDFLPSNNSTPDDELGVVPVYENLLSLRELMAAGELSREDFTDEELDLIAHPERALDDPVAWAALQDVVQRAGQPKDDLDYAAIEAAFPHREAAITMVDWAKWTWNPVTGCLHDREYCYAHLIAEIPVHVYQDLTDEQE